MLAWAIDTVSSDTGPVLSALSLGPWLWAAHHQRSWQVIPEAMFTPTITRRRAYLTARDIGIHPLAPQLVIGQCLSHDASP